MAKSDWARSRELVAAIIMACGMQIGIALPMPVFESLNLNPLDIFREPELQLDIVPRSRPIAIHIEYEIRDQDLPDFLNIMIERRRVRIRDGAQVWALLRNLENPQKWTKTYHSPTWVDYVRHNIRRTKADAENYERLLAVHQGSGPPLVSRMIERQVIPPADDVFHQTQIEPH